MTPRGSSGSSTTDDIATAIRAAVEKEVVDAGTVKKSVNDATAVKKAADETVMVKKAAGDAATVSSGSSLASSAGAKRVAMISGSTPPAKRQFLGSSKPWYVAQTFIYHFLYCICDLAYSVPSSGRSPPSGGQYCGSTPNCCA
jgi:hypothetical protein